MFVLHVLGLVVAVEDVVGAGDEDGEADGGYDEGGCGKPVLPVPEGGERLADGHVPLHSEGDGDVD